MSAVKRSYRIWLFWVISIQCLAVLVLVNWMHHRNKTRLLRRLTLKVQAIQQGIQWQRVLHWLGPKSALAQSPAPLSNPRNRNIPDHYHRLEAIYTRMRQLAADYPEVVSIQKIGESTTLSLPIYAIKISDYPHEEEDETAILFTGLHHAREPVGTLACMRLAERLAADYRRHARVRRWLDELEIWIVPVVNPDGYKFLIDHQVPFPWWRKNLRDNDGDGYFDPIIDGVDLNRNYNFNWEQGGEGNPSSWFYRGTHPFSEKEIIAIKDLALRENVVCGISFHTYGEAILYPWGNYYPPPDQKLILQVAHEMAERMLRLNGRDAYSVLPLNGRVGQSSVWLYGRLRSIDFIVELGQEHFPKQHRVEQILKSGVSAAYYLIERSQRSGLWGHVRDAQTANPVRAKIRVRGWEARHVYPRVSESRFGRFERWLLPGKYTLKIEAEGYQTKTVKNVRIYPDRLTLIEINLERKQSSLPMSHH